MDIEIKDKLYKSIKEYCEVNDLVFNDYINQLLQKEFMLDKYGERPSVIKPIEETPKIIEITVEEKPKEEGKETKTRIKEKKEIENKNIDEEGEIIIKPTIKKRKLK